MDYDILLQIFRYFCRFVPTDVLRKMAVTPDYAAIPGFNETISEVTSGERPAVISGIDSYIFSANAEFVADAVRNSHKVVLFCEYGNVEYDRNGLQLYTDIAVTVAKPYNTSNRDNMTELLTANEMQNLLIGIIAQMQADSEAACACGQFLIPSEIVPVDPKAFYNRIGFTAFFRVLNPILKANELPEDIFNTSGIYGQNPLANYYTKFQCDARFAPIIHTHNKSDITDFAHTHTKSEILDFAHTHEISEVTGLQTQLDRKASVASVDSLAQEVSTKASKAIVEQLALEVAGKVSNEELTAAVNAINDRLDEQELMIYAAM
ncbi:MAG: hypothetical protein IIT93_03115 [Paludibacteraceae bacterium]|nr:hypothetical protein [Paludibacteraceae bacterium]MBQ3929604.1 hypothetical protein [Paludibacteraceae bacterium]MBQ5524492.1 hypothetical protein [Paludibacteraceae bacterium]